MTASELRDRINQKLDTLSPAQLSLVMNFVELLEYKQKAPLGERMRKLFRETQALPGVNEITEEEIAAEIEAYRRGE